MARVMDGRNRASASEAASFVDEYEKLELELEKEKSAYMNRCKVHRTAQKELLDDAKAQGVPKSLVKDIVKTREYDRKAREMRENLDDDQAEFFVDIRKALGDFSDLPLGQAAVEQDDASRDAVLAAVAQDRAEITDEELAESDNVLRMRPDTDDEFESAAPASETFQ